MKTAAALTLCCTVCLLQGALCREFKVIMPKAVEFLQGSCVTIPCSFDVDDKHDSNLDHTCGAKWSRDRTPVFDSKDTGSTAGKLIGDLTSKDCTTTLNIKQGYRGLIFRIECQNILKYTFYKPTLDISVKAVPPTPTLRPSTLKVKEGTSVTLTCSAPAPCTSHPPRVTWTPSLGESRETMEELGDKTKVKTSVLNFTASRLHHGQEISCAAAYSKRDGSTVSSVSARLTAAVLFPPQILPSPNCTKTETEVNCSCETVANPSPTLHWYLNGLPVNHSDAFAVRTEPVKAGGVRSIVTVSRSPLVHRSTLVCNSSNSLGSVSHSFHVISQEHQTPEMQGKTLTFVLITTLAVLLLLLCPLFIIRAHCYPPKRKCTLGTSSAAISHFKSSAAETEVPNTEEENIYVNIHQLRQADVPQPPSEGSKENEDESDVIYTSVKVMSKKQQRRRRQHDDSASDSSYALEMENPYAGTGTRKENEVECEYAQVKFKDRTVML